MNQSTGTPLSTQYTRYNVKAANEIAQKLEITHGVKLAQFDIDAIGLIIERNRDEGQHTFYLFDENKT
jgi:hypothetical protein